MNNLMV